MMLKKKIFLDLLSWHQKIEYTSIFIDFCFLGKENKTSNKLSGPQTQKTLIEYLSYCAEATKN